jgi:hypothetical protein
MRWVFEGISAFGVLIIAGCTVHYLTTVFLWPEYAATQEDEEQDRRRTLLGKWRYYGYSIAAFVGATFCIHQGAVTALHWIPQGWLDHSDTDGNRDGIEFSLAFLLAFFGALGLESGLSKLSNRIVRDGMEIRRLQQALEAAAQHSTSKQS